MIKGCKLLLCAAVLTVGAMGACCAYTVDDYKSAMSLMGKQETYPQAIELFGKMSADDSFVSANPEEAATARLKLGWDLANIQKKPVDAVLMFEKSMAVAPAGTDTRKMVGDTLAMAYLAIPDGAAKSVALYQQLITDYPGGNVSTWKQMMGEGCAAQGQYDKAIAVCEEAVSTAPNAAAAVGPLKFIAEVQHIQKKYQDEVATLRKLAASVPDTPDAKEASARADVVTLTRLTQTEQDAVIDAGRQTAIRSLVDFAKSTEDRYVDGVAAMQKALDLGPDDPKLVVEAELWLGAQYRASAQHQQAVDMGEKLLTDCKGQDNEKEMTVQAKMLIGFGYQCLGKYDKAIPALKDVVEHLDPTLVGGWYNLAACYNMSGNYAKATELYDKVAKDFPESPVAGECQSEKATMLVSKLNKVDEGIATFREILTSAGNKAVPTGTVEFVKAVDAARTGKSGIDTVISLIPDTQRDAHRGMLITLADAVRDQLRKPVDARAIYSQALELTDSLTEKADIQFTVAECDYSAGNNQAAAADYRTLCEMLPSGAMYPQARFMVGQCLLQMGDRSGAKDAFEGIVRDFTDGQYVESARQHLAGLTENMSGGESK